MKNRDKKMKEYIGLGLSEEDFIEFEKAQIEFEIAEINKVRCEIKMHECYLKLFRQRLMNAFMEGKKTQFLEGQIKLFDNTRKNLELDLKTLLVKNKS